MFERPPAGISRQLPATEAILLGVGSNGSQEIEEIGDDFRASVRVDADWDEGVEGIAGEVRV
jgi:hypothetical protein